MKLDEQNFPWFDEQWAAELRDRTRELIRIYTEACAAVWRMPHPYRLIHPGGLWGGRRLWVIGWLVRDAVIRHIQIHLKQATVINYLVEIVRRSTTTEKSLGIKQTAPAEDILAAKERQAERGRKREAVLLSLTEAANDIRSLQEQVSKYKSVSNQIVGSILGLTKNIAPLALLAWIIREFAVLANKPLWQGTVLCALWIVLYNLSGLLGVPFHDASYRKYLLFEGYIGKPEDGVSPLFPPASRLETAFYEHLGIPRPIPVSWDDLIPLFHYLVTIIIVIASLCLLPLNRQLLPFAISGGLWLAWLNARRFLAWRALISNRYDQSVWTLIAHTLLLSISGNSRGATESEQGS